MSIRPFRFIHAGDFHLERPLMGVAEVPDHLRKCFLESPFSAAELVFDAALAEDVDFVVLTGGLLNTAEMGPRGPLFLTEQFVRLAEHGIKAYWAGSPIDPPDSWPGSVKLPQNVHFFPRGQIEGIIVQREGSPLAKLLGTSCDEQRPWRPDDFTADPAGLFTVAVAHGEADSSALQARGVNYWALGGPHDRCTPLGGPAAIHYCGTTQGRCPAEAGVHGCTLVQVDEHSPTRTSLIPTDSVRWIAERLTIEPSATIADLEARLRERLNTLSETMPSVALLISWTVAGSGPMADRLRRGQSAAELLERFRNDYGHRSPAAWSVSLEVESAPSWPREWYEQETIRGDFLRAVRQFQMNPGESLGLEAYLAETDRDGELAAVAELADTSARERILREAAVLGVDLLTGEESDA